MAMTEKRKALVAALAEPDNASIAAAARAAGMHPNNARLALRNDAVKNAADRARAKRLDKARGMVADIDRLGRAAARALARLADDPAVTDDPLKAMQLATLAVKLKTEAAQYRERFGGEADAAAASQEGIEAYHRNIERAVAAAFRAGQDRWPRLCRIARELTKTPEL